MRKAAITIFSITCLLIAVMPWSVMADSVDVEFQLAILAPGATPTPTPVPESTPTPTPTPRGGAAGPPTHIPPQQRPDPYVDGESMVSPYVYVGMLDGIPFDPGDTGQTYARQPRVKGKTNLHDAVVFVELSDFPGVLYTVHANVSGIWEFTIPVTLGYGWHTLFVTALSPIEPSLRAHTTFQFQIIPIPLVQPTPLPTPTPAGPLPHPSPLPTPAVSPSPAAPSPSPVPTPTPSVPPLPLIPPTPLPPPAQLIDVDVIIQPPNVQVTPPQHLPVTVRLERITPDGQEPVFVRLKVTDEHGQVVLEHTREVVVPKAAEFTEDITLPPATPAGRYWVSAEIQQASTTVLSTGPFIVATAAPFLWPATTRAGGTDLLLRLGVSASIVLFFIFWIVVEFIRSRQKIKISPEDLRRSGMV